MSRGNLEALKGLLLYHNTEDDFEKALKCFDEEEPRLRAMGKKRK